MRILLINYEYPPLGGGGGIASCRLAEEWVAQGHEVHVVTSHFAGLEKEEAVAGVKVFRLPVWGRKELATATFCSLISFPLLGKKLIRRLFQKYSYDLIHTHFAVPSGPLGAWASKRYGLPNVLFIHGGDIYDPSKKLSPHRWWFFRKAVQKILNQSHQVLCQSENTRENAVKFYHYDGEIQVIPLGFQPPVSLQKQSREQLGLSGKAFYLIGVGRLVKRKNFDLLIRVLSGLPPEICLILVGDGPEEKELKNLVREKNLLERVIFAGRLEEEAKYQFLLNADLYTLSSLHEGYGIVLQEAMEAGLPIVSTNHGGQTDFLVEGENALLVSPEDETAFREAVIRIYENESLRKEMAQNNQRKIKDFYISGIASRQMEIFRETLRNFKIKF